MKSNLYYEGKGLYRQLKHGILATLNVMQFRLHKDDMPGGGGCKQAVLPTYCLLGLSCYWGGGQWREPPQTEGHAIVHYSTLILLYFLNAQ